MNVRAPRTYYGRRWYAVLLFFPYQAAFGLTLRWYGGRPHLRLYLGPIKAGIGELE